MTTPNPVALDQSADSTRNLDVSGVLANAIELSHQSGKLDVNVSWDLVQGPLI